MNIDLTKLITGTEEELIIEEVLNFPVENLNSTSIKELKEVIFKGSITKLYDDTFELSVTITGIMVHVLIILFR